MTANYLNILIILAFLAPLSACFTNSPCLGKVGGPLGCQSKKFSSKSVVKNESGKLLAGVSVEFHPESSYYKTVKETSDKRGVFKIESDFKDSFGYQVEENQGVSGTLKLKKKGYKNCSLPWNLKKTDQELSSPEKITLIDEDSPNALLECDSGSTKTPAYNNPNQNQNSTGTSFHALDGTWVGECLKRANNESMQSTLLISGNTVVHESMFYTDEKCQEREFASSDTYVLVSAESTFVEGEKSILSARSDDFTKTVTIALLLKKDILTTFDVTITNNTNIGDSGQAAIDHQDFVRSK